jgi:hypothetical protein
VKRKTFLNFITGFGIRNLIVIVGVGNFTAGMTDKLQEVQ